MKPAARANPLSSSVGESEEPDPVTAIPNSREILEFVASLDCCQGADRVEPLLKGYSLDHKFVIYHGMDAGWLFRLSGPDTLSDRESQAGVLRELHRRGVPCPDAIAVGVFNGSWAYLVTTFLTGEDADEALPLLSPATQHRLGLEAGKCLAELHLLEGRESHEIWHARRIRKYRRRVSQLTDRGVPFPDRRLVEAFVEQHLDLLKNSPVRFQHDDFHPGNLLVRDEAFAGVIDFNRCDEGDPIEDFYKLPLFTLHTSLPFARGQVEGYLAACDPPAFWKRYHLLLAMNFHGMLVWIRETGRIQDIIEHDRRVSEMVRQHDWEHPDRPAWFMR